jgi:hypothetical protein
MLMNELILKLQAEFQKSGCFKPTRAKIDYSKLAAKLKENPDTPIDTGELKESYSASVKDDTIIARYSTPYAARIYYDPEIKHHTGTGRWFENDWTSQAVADAIKDELKEN